MSDADVEALRRRLGEALLLKALPRAGWARVGVREAESVAAHSWGVAWLVLALCPIGLDRGLALSIAVIHDLAEVRVGDLTPYDSVGAEEKHRRERRAMEVLLGPLRTRDELFGLWMQYEEQSSPEAIFVKACDKLDMALQAHAYAAEQGVETGEFVASALRVLSDRTLRALAMHPGS
jgi:putative hydrolases of HD superfamily